MELEDKKIKDRFSKFYEEKTLEYQGRLETWTKKHLREIYDTYDMNLRKFEEKIDDKLCNKLPQELISRHDREEPKV